MEAMRESWTDERLDDLREGIGEFRAETKVEFAAVHGEFAAVRKEMREEFAAVRREMGNEFTALRAEMKEGFDGLQRLMIQFMGIAIAALAGVVASLVGVIASILL